MDQSGVQEKGEVVKIMIVIGSISSRYLCLESDQVQILSTSLSRDT